MNGASDLKQNGLTLSVLRTLFAIYLAVAIAILPIAVTQAFALSADQHAGASGNIHGLATDCHDSRSTSSAASDAAAMDAVHRAQVRERAHGPAVDCHAVDPTAGTEDVAPQSGSHDLTGSACCNMSCHFFQVSGRGAPMHARSSSFASVSVQMDEQMSGRSPTPGHRPPRAA